MWNPDCSENQVETAKALASDHQISWNVAKPGSMRSAISAAELAGVSAHLHDMEVSWQPRLKGWQIAR